jgi:ubiquinone/menaquinone biosynthesis C-methylase UbiE
MPPITWDTLYTHHGEAYENLVAAEDYQGNLLPAIERIQLLDGTVAAEFGCGTGRVTALLAGRVKRLHAFDLSRPMLDIAKRKLGRPGWGGVTLAQADSRCMPARSGWADLAVEGWSFLHITVAHLDDWQAQLGRALDEMERAVRPGGKLILIETLGTGETEPNPAERFRPVYDWLERERGFAPSWIRTDYRFPSPDPVRDVVVPLFGEAMLERLIPDPAGFVLPECTGLWRRESAPAH